MPLSKLCMSAWSCSLARYRRVWTATRDKMFGRHLLATNVSISMLLSAVGDAIQQRYQMVNGGGVSFNTRRSREMAVTGASVGLVCHYWYLWLDASMPGHSMSVVTKKVFVDQLIFSPVLLTIFLLTLQLMRGSSLGDFHNAIRSQFVQLYVAEWIVWPPAQAFSFYALPTRYRVLWDNLVSLGYDTYSSYVVNECVHETAGDNIAAVETKMTQQR